MAFFGNQISFAASSVKRTWENYQNMQLKFCDWILVGNSNQGTLFANYLTLGLRMTLVTM